MKIRAGFDIAFDCVQETPMVLMLSVHPSRQNDLLTDHLLRFSSGVVARNYQDMFGNVCTRLVAPAGLLEIGNDFIIADSGLPDDVAPDARQFEIDALPDKALPFLLGSRYCDTEKLSDLAWSLFGGILGGWRRVKTICDYVHDHIEFGYHHARCDRTTSEGHAERIGVLQGLRAPCPDALPLHEHSSALLHRLSRRYRRPARSCPNGFQRLVRSIS